MARIAAALMAVSWLASSPAAAGDLEFFTGQSLYAECSAKPGAPDYPQRAARCVGYVIGVSDALQAAQGAGASQRVCLPATASAAQVVDAVAKYLADHPDKRPIAAQDLVSEALSQKYPCG
jgi:hypothetical protein